MSVFFTSQKTILKSWLDTSSTASCLSSSSSFFFISQSRQLLDTWWIDWKSSCLLDSFSTAGWSIELLFLIRYFCSSIPSRHLHLSTSISSTPSSTDGSTPLDTSIFRELLRIYTFILLNPVLISSISLDLFAPIHLPNTLISLLSCSSRFLQAFSIFFFTW